MKLYDTLIEQLPGLLGASEPRVYAYDPGKVWPENANFELMLQKDMAYELGAGGKPSVNCTFVTSNRELLREDAVVVYGRELREIKEESAYARVTLVLVREMSESVDEDNGETRSLVREGAETDKATGSPKGSAMEGAETDKATGSPKGSAMEGAETDKPAGSPKGSAMEGAETDKATGSPEGPADEEAEGAAGADTDTEKLYQMLQEIEFVKYHVFPKGYMVRNSGQTHREQVRVGRRELEAGMTFALIGNTYIRRYRENPDVLAVRVIFLTAEDAAYNELSKAAERATQIRQSLSKISKGMPTECSVCGIREICSEVEGLRELHFGTGSGNERRRIKRSQDERSQVPTIF